MLWRTPLGRGGRAVMVQHGGTSTFVQTASGHRFVIDNATGRTAMLAENQVWRRTPEGEPANVPGPNRPVRPEYPATPLNAGPGPATQPASPGSGFAGGETTTQPAH